MGLTGVDGRSFGKEFLARYEVVAEIGRGSTGVVLAAHQRGLDRTVAIKYLNVVGPHEEETRKRFLREAKILASLSHPNLVSIFDFGLDDGCPYLVETLLQGTTLEAALKAEPVVPPAVALGLAVQLADGLAHAHDHDIVHRDLNPGNVYVSAEGQVTILDFGLARSTKSQTAITRQGCVVGTPFYMAPEQIRGEVLTPAVDVYALGTMVFEMLSGRLPFSSDESEHLRAKLFDQPESLGTAARRTLPDGLVPLVDSMLATDPAARPKRGRDVVGALRRAAAAASAASAPDGDRPASSLPTPLRGVRHPLPRISARSTRTLYAVAGGVLVTLAVAAWFLLGAS